MLDTSCVFGCYGSIMVTGEEKFPEGQSESSHSAPTRLLEIIRSKHENPLYQHRVHIWSVFFTSLDTGNKQDAGKQNETNGSDLDK